MADESLPDNPSDDVSKPRPPKLGGWLENAARHLGRLGYSIELSEAELEQRLAVHFPWTVSKLGLSIRLEEPRLGILENGLLRLGLELEVAGNAVVRRGKVQLIGNLRYEAEAGGFFLGNVQVEHLELAKWQTPLWPLRKILEPAIGWYLKDRPVVKFEVERRSHALMKAVLERVETRCGILRLHLKLMPAHRAARTKKQR